MSPAKKLDMYRMFMESAIHNVALNGMENLRTKDVADYTGYSEATLFRYYKNKELLPRGTFIFLDAKVSRMLIGNRHIVRPDDASVEEIVRKSGIISTTIL